MPKSILIVEDEPDISNLARMRLENYGYKISVAVDSKSAFASIRKKAPDLILLDLLLTDERGEDICKKIKKDKNLKRIPVILFTASACDIESKILETGADDGIMKPFEPEKFLEKIKKFIS